MTYGRGFEGLNYQATKNLDITDIAKMVRADIKAAQKKGDLPLAKVSVRIQRYSGGQALRISLKDVVPDMIFGSDEYRAVLRKIDAIVEAYNFDDSDPMTDYCHVRFHNSVWVEAISTRTGEKI